MNINNVLSLLVKYYSTLIYVLILFICYYYITKVFKKVLRRPACVDVILSEQKDGSLKSSPFFVIFLSNQTQKEIPISISINSQKLSFQMILLPKERSPFFFEKKEGIESPHDLLKEKSLKFKDWFTQPKNKFRETVEVATLDHSLLTPNEKQMKEIQEVIKKSDKDNLTIEFSDGNYSCEGKMYYFKSSDSVIISDIDGTVTRSDMRGHIYSSMQKDYTHAGCSKLFSKIVKNGYKLIYLTARPVSMIKETKRYIHSIDQDNYKMPDFPIITSPNKSAHAFIREVLIREPHTFKIHILNTISNLFDHPFYGGFGNRVTDDISYSSVGIPLKQIFRIDKSSLVENEETKKTYATYNELEKEIDDYFPPIFQ
eukprot:gene10129-2548_t